MTPMRQQRNFHGWLLVVVLAVTLVSPAVHAQDWPAFRGPTGQGHSSEHGLPLEWSETTNLVWKTPVPGRGWSSPVVADGRVWLTTATAVGAGSLRLLAYDVETGQEVVNTEVFRVDETASPNPKNSLASPTPVLDVDGARVYVHFGADGTAALTTTGEVVWTTRFPYVTQHGNGGSPVLYNGRLILSVDGYDTAYVVALDAATGEERWRTARRQPISQAYSTPLVIRVGDRDQLFSIGAFRATAYDPESGEEIWEVSYGDGFSNVPAPVFGHGDGLCRDRVPGAVAARCPRRRPWRRDRQPHRLDAEAWRAADTVAVARRRRTLHRKRPGRRDLSRCKDRRDPLAGTAGRQLLGVTGVRRRTYLLSE